MSESEAAAAWAAPSDEQVERAIVLIGHPERARVFFQQLENPKWLAPLQGRKVFAEAPAPVPVDEWIQFPRWLAGDYLVRMAPIEPEEVVEILLKVKDNGNPWAHRQIAAAAVAMPPEHAARLVDRVATYVAADRSSMLDPLALVELLEHLSNLEDARSFRRLADGLYAPQLPTPRDEESPLPLRRVTAGLDDYWYAETLPRAWTVLKARLGANANRSLVRWLADWQRMSGYVDADDHDNSYIWCPSVAEIGGPTAPPLGATLVNLLCRASVDDWRSGTSLSEIESTLDRGQQPIFLRMWMHVLAIAIRERRDEAAMASARAVLLTEQSFDLSVRHEFAALARLVLANAEASYVESWIAALHLYPSIIDETLRERLANGDRSPEDVSDDELDETRRRSRRFILTAIGDPLPNQLASWLAELDEEFGVHGSEPDDVPFQITSGFTGPISPVPFSELSALTPAEMIAYVRAWQPPEATGWPPPPTPEGLGRELSNLVKADPTGFAAVLGGVADLHPTYVRGLLDGFEAAIRDGSSFPWPAVLALVEFVAAQPDEGNDPVPHFMERDVGWRWSHSQAARLLRVALERNHPFSPPIEEREHIWSALVPLTDSPNPTPEDDQDYAGSMGPMDRSLNVVRGQAMRAVLAYLTWARRTSAGQLNEAELREVVEVLDRHLEPDRDPSTAIRSVYGEHFWFLLETLPTWTTENAPRIFDEGAPPRSELGDAAWSSYLAVHNPNRVLFDLLREQYQHRVTRLADVDSAGINRARDIEYGGARLAEHVLLLFSQGTITLDSADQLVRYLFETAPSELLGEALGHLFWRIFRTEGPLDADFLGRIMRLWEWRAGEVAAERATSAELRGFGWLVRSGRFPAEWMLTYLAQVANALSKVEMSEQVGEAIAPYARSHTELVLAVYRGLVRNREDGWIAHQLSKHAALAIAAALRDPDDDLQRVARALMSAFAEAGVSNIREQVSEAGASE